MNRDGKQKKPLQKTGLTGFPLGWENNKRKGCEIYEKKTLLVSCSFRNLVQTRSDHWNLWAGEIKKTSRVTLPSGEPTQLVYNHGVGVFVLEGDLLPGAQGQARAAYAVLRK